MESIKLYIMSSGSVIIGNEVGRDDKYIRLAKPFRLLLGEENKVSVGSILFGKEEDIEIKHDDVNMIISATDAMLDLYKKYKQKLFSEIILPDTNIKL